MVGWFCSSSVYLLETSPAHISKYVSLSLHSSFPAFKASLWNIEGILGHMVTVVLLLFSSGNVKSGWFVVSMGRGMLEQTV